MRLRKLSNGYGVFFDPSQSTSGQRFFRDLYRILSKDAIPLEDRPKVLLFNVSASFYEIAKAKFYGQKVVLRIDGLYYDRLSIAFLERFSWPLKMLFSFGLKYPSLHDLLAHLANFIDQNYGAFLKIIFADLLIYQSNFSRDSYFQYFRSKPYKIIVNGSNYHTNISSNRNNDSIGEIKLIVIYNDWKPSKRMKELIYFVYWAHEIKRQPISLTILGYTGRIPRAAGKRMKQIVENSSFIHILPEFKDFNDTFAKAFYESDMYITFSNRDPCPNVVVEAMAHGLPVVGLHSGGHPDIVGDAGILLPENDNAGFFAPYRFESDFPHIDYDAVLKGVLDVKKDLILYHSRVKQRFIKDLGIEVVANRYTDVLKSFL